MTPKQLQIILAVFFIAIPVVIWIMNEEPVSIGTEQNPKQPHAGALIFDGEVHLPPDGKLRVLVTECCSGSSFVLYATRDFLQRRGYDVSRGKAEVYKAKKNLMFERAKELAPENCECYPDAESEGISERSNRCLQVGTWPFRATDAARRRGPTVWNHVPGERP